MIKEVVLNCGFVLVINNGFTVCWLKGTIPINTIQSFNLPTSMHANNYGLSAIILDSGTQVFKISGIILGSTFFSLRTTFSLPTGFCAITCGY